MLFSSFEFIFHFLPVVFAVAFLLYRFGQSRYIAGWLVASSIYYYTDFKSWHLAVLAVMLAFNYFASLRIASKNRIMLWLWSSIVFDISILAWFKYAHTLTLLPEEMIPSTLPLGISFYTFQLIAYVVDIYKERLTPAKPLKYLFFVLFFPQLIAGPIVHYLQIAPQVKELGKKRCCEYIDSGALFFIIGLLKKVWLADTFAIFADKAFSSVAAGKSISMVDAWGGLLSYSMQIYFDFCAYSEMAIGLGLIFGIRLPLNFISPYKADSFRDFWRRWHITLSTFLRDYLYIPLGGSRRGRGRTLLNVIAVMTLAGAWHGSGWTFVLWGFGHGVMIALNHLLYKFKLLQSRVLKPLKIFVTFTVVTLLWVLFRSDSLTVAMHYYVRLFDISSLHIDNHWEFWKVLYHWESSVWLWVIPAVLGVWLLPNMKKVAGYREEWREKLPSQSLWLGIFSGMALWVALKMMSGEASRSFIYFMF